MKIEYGAIDKGENRYITISCIYRFKIIRSILKSHYKSLARMSMFFNKFEYNSGYIRKGDESAFLDLVKKMNNSSKKRCVNSHKKAKEKKSKNKINTKCEHGDLGSLGYKHGDTVNCPHCGNMTVVW